MRKFILFAIPAILVCSVVVFGEDVGNGHVGEKMDAEQRMRFRHQQMELEEKEAEAGFRHRMRELELEEREIEIEHQRHGEGHKCGVVLMVICFVIHILLAIWIYKDIEKRKSGSGIWIVIALLAGLLGALVYAIVRLGDVRKESE